MKLEQPFSSCTTTGPAVHTPSAPAINRRWWPFVLLITGVLGFFLLRLALGSVNIPLPEIISILLGEGTTKASWESIVINFRLPEALTATFAGAALGVSGLMMQTLFRNPLAGPFILGISSGASLGVAFVVLALGTVGTVTIAGLSLLGDFTLAIGAGVGAGVTLLLVLAIARTVRNSTTLLVLGLMFGYLTSAVVGLLLYLSIPERIQAYINWTFGTFSGVTWSQLTIMIPLILLGLILSFFLMKPLNALLLGEHYAASMGLHVARVRLWIIFITALLAGTITAFAGPIGFIGIAVPHLCRTIFATSDHRRLIPSTMLMGALVALIAGLVADVPGNQLVLPLNAITSLLGAPVVIWVILRRRHIRMTT